MSVLYIVATPIGNLSDIILRALEVLKSVDFILAEDTRETKKLLEHYQINTPLISYHQHSKPEKINEIIDLLKQDKNLALVSDAGTPGISDPGNFLVNEVIKRLRDEVKIVPIPGACALTVAASISGFPTDKFVFLGFPPHKKKRQKFFKTIADATETVIIYESKHRILKTLNQLDETLKKRIGTLSELKEENTPRKTLNQRTEIVVCRELTKKFETIYRGNIDEVIEKVKSSPIKGEFVIVIDTKRTNRDTKETKN